MMAIDSSTKGCSKKRFKMVSFGRVCRSIWNYPFIVAILLFLLFLHQYFPSIFYFLLSASPVFACTAALLGALLVHGHPNNHNVSSRGIIDNATQSLETEAPEHTTPTSRESASPRYRFAEVRKDIVEKGLNASGLVGVGSAVLSEHTEGFVRESRNSKLNKFSKPQEKKSKAGFCQGEFGDGEILMAKIPSPNQAESCDSKMRVLHDVSTRQAHLGYSRNQHKPEDDDGDHDSIDYESDIGDKSCLDALISHVILTPQETLPLLDSEEPPLTDNSHDVFPKLELESLVSNQSSSDSDEEPDYQYKEVETGNEDDEDESPQDKKQNKKTISWTKDEKKVLELRSSEKEKNNHLTSLVAKLGDKRSDKQGKEEEAIVASDDNEEERVEKGKGGTRQVTTWTEDDEKNLRNVGNSEQEKNQLLELIAKRRAQRNFPMISERNFINSERYRLPVRIAPISTSRVNPFDIFDNNNRDHDNLNLIPIPGSAPSMARRNHFDPPFYSPRRTHNSPCEASSRTSQWDLMGNLNRQEVGFGLYECFTPGYNLVGDTSKRNFAEFDQWRKEVTFSRHQSFNAAARQPFPSTSTVQKPNNFYMRPVFVPQQQSSKEVANHPSSTKQLCSESSHASVHGEATSKLAQNNEPTVIPNHEPGHSDNKSESSSKVINFAKDDSDAHSGANTDDQEHSLNQTKEARIDANHDTRSSSSMSSVEDGRSSKTSNNEGEKASQEVDDVRKEEINYTEPLTLSEKDNNYAEPVTISKEGNNHSETATISEEGNNHPETDYDTSPGAEKNEAFSLSASEL